MSIRVLHISGGNLASGAARGAYWLHEGLRLHGLESRFLVQDCGKKSEGVFCLAEGVFGKAASFWYQQRNKLPLRAYWRRKGLFSSDFKGFDPTTRPEFQDADIVHLHWIASGAVGLNQFRMIRKPVVWTFRDMWPFTGGCHYSGSCRKFETGCGNCPILGSRQANDLSRHVFAEKQENYQIELHPVAISHWLREEALSSPLFKKAKIEVIPNGIKLQEFRPLKKSDARQMLDLPAGKKIILVGALDLQKNYKGFDKVLEVMELLGKDDCFFLFFGKLSVGRMQGQGSSYRSLGYLPTNQALRTAYAAADVFLAPSLQEAFGKTLVEAMACGTPVVAFDATGPKDIVEHERTGYKARPFSAEDLAAGIRWIVSDKDRHLALCRNARQKAETEFSVESSARRYASLYQKILDR